MVNGKRIGIALGGGGARGFAHWSILRTLAKNGIEVDVFSGTSMGSVIAVALHQNTSFNRSYHQLREFVIKYGRRFKKITELEVNSCDTQSGFNRWMCQIQHQLQLLQFLRQDHLADDSLIDEIMNEFIAPQDLSETAKKVWVCSLDLATGQAFFADRGPAQTLVKASMSIPGYFPPVRMDNRLLFDAASMYPVPIQIFEKDPVDFLIAIDLGSPIQGGFKLTKATDILFRQLELNYSHIISEIDLCADFVIRPEMESIHWSEFHKLDSALKAGSAIAEQIIEPLKSAIKKHKPKNVHDRPWHHGGFTNYPRVATYDPQVKEPLK